MLTPDEYLALRARVGWPTMSPAVAAAALQDSLAIATARDPDGTLLGMARAIGDGFYAVVVDVIVAPPAQDHGIARQVLTELLEHPRVQRAGHVSLFAAPEATELYEDLGFRAEGGIHMERT